MNPGLALGPNGTSLRCSSCLLGPAWCGVGDIYLLSKNWNLLDRDCAECGAFGTGPLAANCSMACAHVNMTLAVGPVLDDNWCKVRTLDNQLFFFLVEDQTGGKTVLRVRPPESKWAAVLGP